MRPVPPRARFLTLGEALAKVPRWDAVICHNITDLLETSSIDAPKLFVVHDVLDGRIAQQSANFNREDMIAKLRQYIAQLGAHAIAVSEMKGSSWGITGKGLPFASDPADYLQPTYERASGLRVANDVVSKRVFLAWDFHEAAFGELPVALVGHNPALGIAAARNWDELKVHFARHRFYVHTADARFEDGYNMAMVEAMAAGLPVVSNAHPTSPLTHGVDGFVATDPIEARAYAEALIGDIELARRMGAAARETVRRAFGPDAFRVRAYDAIGRAGKKFRRRQRTLVAR